VPKIRQRVGNNNDFFMTFTQSIESVFGKYLKGAGRASRSEYWWWQLFTFLVTFAVSFIGELAGYGTILSSALSLVLFCPNLCVAIRRCHDSGHSGWWAICPIVNLVMMFLPSDPEENEYGMPEGFVKEA
jgi:uncharacterized membrane protein YhaH (DUF805 family)